MRPSMDRARKPMAKVSPDPLLKLRWHPAEGENIAPPAVARALLRRAIDAGPGHPERYIELGGLELDAYDFAAAAACFESALRLDPKTARARLPLAHCCNLLHRHE